MDLIDYAILNQLNSKQDTHGKTPITAKTVKEIHINQKPNTIYKRLRKLCDDGYIAKGICWGNAHTYYITKEGIEELRRQEVYDK